jgi:hypothetical protein
MVPRSEALSPGPGVGAEVVISNGQIFAHSPVQVTDVWLSGVKRYSVRPVEVTNTVPTDGTETARMVSPVDPAPLDVAPLEPHATATNPKAANAAPVATRRRRAPSHC